MSFDRSALIEACRSHGVVARVVIAALRGSAPREVGTAMLVWATGQSGTIGGGALEFKLANRARKVRHVGHFEISTHALGPDMGQCCGGAVEIVTEVHDLASAEALPKDVVCRGTGPEPLAVTRLRVALRNSGTLPAAQLISGWMVEPVLTSPRPVWIWGAGHVGRALVGVLDPLPEVALTWVDTAQERFPAEVPPGVTVLPAARPARLAAFAPPEASHLIVTYSHALDLELCHQLLAREFGFLGLIGSRTKWARFRKRLAALGHSPQQIRRITCPIGEPALGKHPQVIAVSVAHDFLQDAAMATRTKERRA
jgi:xanthine dehydrogenase accessory factor